MSEHTKGTWRVAMSTEDGVYVMCGESVVAHVYDMGSGGENNRNIIAAAPELLEECKVASASLHAILAVAYKYEPHFKRIVCGTCNVASPQNGDGNSFKITHDDDCIIGSAIKSERGLIAAIAKAEGCK